MSKTVQDARSFLKKAAQADNDFVEGFESVTSITIPTIAIPITLELTEKEKLTIQKILVDEYQPGTISESLVAQHVEQLTSITKQIKSIIAQSVLLHGERIKQAQDILASYREGAFTKWIMATYGNRQTPYNMLNYYKFYQNASKETQSMIEAAPKKAVYALASREGDEVKKLNFIREHGTSSQSELLILIHETFPTANINKRKPLITTTIEAMLKLCFKLESRSSAISDDDRIDIGKLIQRLQNL